MYLDLLKDIPSELKKRMQRNSCFNFKVIDKELFKQLNDLTGKAYKAFKKRGDNINYNC